jgi:hypothetical protein
VLGVGQEHSLAGGLSGKTFKGRGSWGRKFRRELGGGWTPERSFHSGGEEEWS